MRLHPHLISCIIAATLLFWALARHPYGYYQILRFVTTGTAIYCAYSFWEHRIKVIPWVFVSIAVLFNPLIPIYLDKSTWGVIDVVVGIVFLGAAGVKGREEV